MHRYTPWHCSANGKRGRGPKYSEAASQLRLTIAGLFNLALRHATAVAESLRKLVGIGRPVPNFNTVSRRQKHLAVSLEAHPRTTGLHLLAWSTRIKMLGEGGRSTKKHGVDHRRQWHKVHLGIDATTLEIWAIEVSDNANRDAAMSPCLLNKISGGGSVARLSGDGAYDKKLCPKAVAQRDVQSIFPSCKFQAVGRRASRDGSA